VESKSQLRECESALAEVEAAYHEMDDRRAALDLQLVDAFDYIRRLEDLVRYRVSRENARDEFLAVSVRVWREIDRLSAEPNGYKGIEASHELRVRERKAWERYRETCLGEQP
jgi:hypothetical protein